jgi:hypothetical protein
MPTNVVKEVEYVLELRPRYLWLVGPGTVEPEAHVWRVVSDREQEIVFNREPGVPPPDRPPQSDGVAAADERQRYTLTPEESRS